MYINPQTGKSGSFKVTDSPIDNDSGILKVNFPSPTGFTSGGGDVTSSPYATTYNWSGAGATASGSQTVTVFNNAALTNTTSFTVTPDMANPINGALTVNGQTASGAGTSGYSSVTNFAIGSRTDYTDGGSGLASSTLTVQSFALSSSDGIVNGTCGAATTPFSSPTVISGTTQPGGIVTGRCYLYTLTGTDNVGNVASISTTVKVDTTGPSAPTPTLSAATGNTFISGTTVFINPQTGKSGGFTVTSNPTDNDSGIRNVIFPALIGFTSGGGTISSSPFTTTYAWSGAGATASGSQTVTANNNASLSNTSSFTVTPDTTGPTAGAVTVAGVAATSGGASATVNNSTNANNLFTITGRTDYNADAGSGVASSVLTVQSETLSGSTCGALGSGGPFTSPTTITGTTQPSGILAGFCYVYTLTGTDNVGNTSTITTTVVDNSLSFTVTTQPSSVTAGASNSVTLTAIKNGATDTGYTGAPLTWAGASNSPNGTTPTLPTNPTWSSGQATFNIVLVKAENETLSVTDGTRTGNFTQITVNAAAATKMVFVNCSLATNSATCSPQPISVGNNSDMTFNIQTQDPFGNPSAPSVAISITFTNSDGTFSITAGAPAAITPPATTSGQVTLHHGMNGGTDSLTAHASAGGFADATLTAKK